MSKSIADLKLGESGIIRDFVYSNPVIKILREMGFSRGVQVKVSKIAPWGDPLELNLRNYRLSIRKKDAKAILLD